MVREVISATLLIGSFTCQGYCRGVGDTILVGIGVPDAAAAWESLGFRVADDAVAFANGALLLGREGFVLAAGANGDLEGIPVTSGRLVAPSDHPCGGVELDHVVVLTDDLERTSAAVEEVFGLPCRRVRETETVRQAFHRFADVEHHRGCIVEVVENPRIRATSIMGVVIVVPEVESLAERLGPGILSAPKPAVQPGRLISTVRREVGLGTALALMT